MADGRPWLSPMSTDCPLVGLYREPVSRTGGPVRPPTFLTARRRHA